jgi:hypothetical protein
VLGTWRRALSPKSMGPCDIHLGGWILDLRMLGLRSILHGGWLWTQTHMLRRSIGASNYLGTHVESIGHKRTCGTQLEEEHLA